MRIDLHAHTCLSDGTQRPAELVRAAAAAGLTVLGLTDHDTTDSWAEAGAAAVEVGLDLVRGIEISTISQGRAVHLLAYLPDPTHPELVDVLRQAREGRSSRVPAILARLAELGLDIDLDDVRQAARGSSTTGRPHVADAMVERGLVRDRDEAFALFLRSGRHAHVPRPAPDLVEVLRIVAEAGGVSVLAHPWGRGARDVLQADDIAALREAGLTGLEVDHQDHDLQARAELREIASGLDLVVTGSSDHHGKGKVGHELGCNTTHPDQYRALMEAASRSARASGRRTPALLSS